MKLPENVNYIIRSLEISGFLAYAVGGCVRDMIMNLEPKDWDIATSAKPDEVKALFRQTYDTGLAHGTITVVLNSLKYEITTFRIDGEYKDCRHPENVTYSSNIYDDLKRRDFTINAIAYNANEGFVDPFNGINDIFHKIIRGVGNPSDRIKEDALRMLRAVRFSAVLGFAIDDDTKQAIINNAGLISKISAERVREELVLLLVSQNPNIVFTSEFMSLMQNIYSPLAESLIDNKDSLEKMFAVCRSSFTLRLLILIYYLDTEEAQYFLNKLKLSNAMYNSVFNLHKVRNEVIDTGYCSVAGIISKWGFKVFEDYLYIQMLNCVVQDSSPDYVNDIEEHYRFIIENNFPIFLKDLSINGYDLKKEFNVAGAVIGKTLNGLLDYVHANPYKNTYEGLLAEAYRLITKSNVNG